MEFELNNAENHLQLCALTDAITAAGLNESLKAAKSSLDDCPYLIIDMTEVILMEKQAKQMINGLLSELGQQKGLLLICNLAENLQEGIEAECVPSLQEGVDLIFMDQLEKEFEEED